MKVPPPFSIDQVRVRKVRLEETAARVSRQSEQEGTGWRRIFTYLDHFPQDSRRMLHLVELHVLGHSVNVVLAVLLD